MRMLCLSLCTLLAVATATAQVKFTQTFYATSGQGLGIASSDFNRDGRPDVVVGTNNAFEVFNNLGGGKFAAPVSYTLNGNAEEIISADLNNDGWPDLIVNTFNTQPAIDIFLNNGDGTFRPGASLAGPLIDTVDIAAGDLNHDGNIDLVVLSSDFSTNKSQINVYLGNGTGSFTAGEVLPMANEEVAALNLADVFGDGNLDIINNRTPKVLIWRGNGNGTFQTPISLTPPQPCAGSTTCGDDLEGIAVTDVNNDGILDLAVLQAHNCGGGCGDNTVYIYKNSGGVFTRINQFDIGSSAGASLLAGDLNGDQNMDLFNVNGSSFGAGNIYALGNGNGTFGSNIFFNGENASFMVIRDFNLDSRHDLAISDWMGNGFNYFQNTSAFTNCAPPGSANIAARICSPGNGASVSSPVTVRASGNSPAGVQRLEVWIDGKKRAQRWNDQLAKRFTLASGKHRIAVVAVDRYKGSASSAVSITVP